MGSYTLVYMRKRTIWVTAKELSTYKNAPKRPDLSEYASHTRVDTVVRDPFRTVRKIEILKKRRKNKWNEWNVFTTQNNKKKKKEEERRRKKKKKKRERVTRIIIVVVVIVIVATHQRILRPSHEASLRRRGSMVMAMSFVCFGSPAESLPVLSEEHAGNLNFCQMSNVKLNLKTRSRRRRRSGRRKKRDVLMDEWLVGCLTYGTAQVGQKCEAGEEMGSGGSVVELEEEVSGPCAVWAGQACHQQALRSCSLPFEKQRQKENNAQAHKAEPQEPNQGQPWQVLLEWPQCMSDQAFCFASTFFFISFFYLLLLLLLLLQVSVFSSAIGLHADSDAAIFFPWFILKLPYSTVAACQNVEPS